jgi:hypothetical protein
MATFTMRRTVTSIGPRQVAIMVMVAATALTHLYLGVITHIMLASQPGVVAQIGGAAGLTLWAVLFDLNFAGYIALVTTLYLPALRRFQRMARWALMGYAAVTVIGYFVFAQGHFDMMGYADKAVELLLISLLVIEDRQAR